jgi:hypothetical protein
MNKFKLAIAFVVAIIVLLLLSAWAKDQLPREPEQTPPTAIRAVYLVHGQGELDKSELDRHPEVVVTGSFKELKEYAKQPVAIWIDKSWIEKKAVWEKIYYDGITGEGMGWFHKLPKKTYPIVLVGYGNKFYAFGPAIMYLCCELGPPILKEEGQAPGFSVYHPDLFEGYAYKPHVEDILRITSGLLDGTLQPTPTLPPVAMPTLPI